LKFLKCYYQEMLLILILLLIMGMYVIGGLYYFYHEDDVIIEEQIIQNEIEVENSNIEKEQLSHKKFVDLKGAVSVPGVYEVSDETIINDVIVLAGGFTKNAYTKNINLSQKLRDETVIYVYTNYEYSLLSKKDEPKEVIACVCPEPDLSACLNSGSSVIENGESSAVQVPKEENISPDETVPEVPEEKLININTASKEMLMTLKGIGEAKAQKIIEYREINGNFLVIEDIKKVSGISENIYENIKEAITI